MIRNDNFRLIMKKIPLLILFIIFSSCTRFYHLNRLENKINLLLKSDSTSVISLDTISSFEWDELIVATPYADLDKIKGYHLSRFPKSIKSFDTFIFLGFTYKKKGVRWLNIKLNEKADKLFKDGIYQKSDCKFYEKKVVINPLKL